MAKKSVEEKINLESILFKCRDILRQARNSGSFFEKRDMMLTLVFLRFIGEKYEDGLESLRQKLIDQGLDPDDEEIRAAFFDDPTFTDGTYNLPPEARWSTIINTPAPQLNVALDTALHSLAASDKQLEGCFVEGTFTTRNLAPNDIKKLVDEVSKISHKAFGVGEVKGIDGTVIVVTFNGVDKMFQFPGAFENGFLSLNMEPQTMPTKQDEVVKDPVLALIRKSGFSYVDKRPSGGCLWIIAGEKEGKKLVEKCEKLGVTFTFVVSGGKASKGKPAWYTK